MPQLSEKPRLGFSTRNQAWNPGFNVCNSTAAIGLQFACSETVSDPVESLTNGTCNWTLAVDPTDGFTGGATNTISVTYQGDGNFLGSSGSTTVTETTAATYTVATDYNSATLSPGASTTIPLTVQSGNYTGTVSFVVSTSSPLIMATVSSVTIPALGIANATLTINASRSAALHPKRLPWLDGSAVAFCAVLLGAPLARLGGRRKATILLLAAILLLCFVVACGGGGGSTNGGSSPTSPQTYTVTVTPTGTGTVVNPSPVTITVTVQ